jgi:magnesium chelatase subunit I
MTGKIELEYEGELKGVDKVAQELVRNAVGQVFSHYFDPVDFQQIVNWFDLGGTLKVNEETSSQESFNQLRVIQGLPEKAAVLGAKKKDDLAVSVSACEFILMGYALCKINRSQ